MKKIAFTVFALLLGSTLGLSALEYVPAPVDFRSALGEQGKEYLWYLESPGGQIIPFFFMTPAKSTSPLGTAVFLPQYGGNASMWKTQARNATAAGVLSVSLQVEISVPGKRVIGWGQVDGAMEQIVQWLRSSAAVNPDRIGLIGSSLGANHALRIFASDPKVFRVFSLSAGIDYFGYKPGDSLGSADSRQAVVVAAKDDGEADAALLEWQSKYPRAEYLEAVSGGHGYALVQNQKSVAERLKKFLVELQSQTSR